jgi:hypothetical protein
MMLSGLKTISVKYVTDALDSSNVVGRFLDMIESCGQKSHLSPHRDQYKSTYQVNESAI